MKAYPNPVKVGQFITIETGDTPDSYKSYTVTLYEMQGRVLAVSVPVLGNSISLPIPVDIRSAMYLLKVSTPNDKPVVLKILIFR